MPPAPKFTTQELAAADVVKDAPIGRVAAAAHEQPSGSTRKAMPVKHSSTREPLWKIIEAPIVNETCNIERVDGATADGNGSKTKAVGLGPS
jgi:hypothetical protein